MSSVLAPSFLLELGAYAIAAAGIRLIRNRSCRARQQEAQEHPETIYQHTSPRVIGLSQASPLLSTCRSSSRSPQPCPDEVRSSQAAGTSCKGEAKGRSAAAQAADVVMPEADAVLLQPQTITAATEAAATPSDVPSRIKAPPDTAFAHITPLSVTHLPGSPGNRVDNMGSDRISSHSHNSNLVHGDASRDLDVLSNTSHGRTSAENCTGDPSSCAACHNRAASKAPEAAAEGEQLHLQDVMCKDEQQDVSSGPDRADAIGPQNVKVAHRGVEVNSAGDCEQASGPSHESMSEDDPDVDIMTREESPACDHMAVDDPSNGGNDVISDSETSKQEEEEVASGMDWAWGADTPDDDQCDNVDEGRSLLLSAIQKHKPSAEHDLEHSEMQLFVSKNRTCGPLIGGTEEEEEESAEPAIAVPGASMTEGASGAQPNDLLQEIASVTLRLLAGALRHSPSSEVAQPKPSPFSQTQADQQEQSPDLDSMNPVPSQAGQTLADPGIEEEEGQLAEGSQSHSAGICVEAMSMLAMPMPLLAEESGEAHELSPTSSGQPSHFGSAHPDSLTEAEVCSQGSFGQPDQATELEHATEEEDQDSIQECDQTHDSHSNDAEAIGHNQVADATHQGAALKDALMANEDETHLKGRQARDEDAPCGQQARKPLFGCNASRDWMQRWVRRCRSSLPAAHLPHLPQHDAVARPDSSPDAEAPMAMSLEPEADMAADDIQHGQISRHASDSAANAPAASLPSESPASHPLALGVAALAAALSWPAYSSSAAALSAPEAPAADTLSPANIDETRLAGPGHCEQGEIEESDELCPAINAPVEHSAQRAEDTEESGEEVHVSKGDKCQLGDHHYMLCGSGLGIVAQPGLHQPQQGQLEQANSIMSDHYESRAFHAKHSGADAQTDWGRELPAVDSAPPIASNSPPGSPTSSSAWGSPDEAAVNSPADRLAHSDSPDWGSARGAFPNRPQFRAVPASPAARSPAWGSPLRASCSRSLRHVSPSKSPAWQSPGRAARHSLDWHSPFSPGSPAAPSATLPHGNIGFRTDQSQPTRWSRSPDYVHPFWNPPEFVSAPAARAADDSPDYSQPLKEAEDGLSEPAMSPRYLRSGGGMEEEDQQMYAEPDHEREDNGMAEIQQGQNEEEDQPDASQDEGAYAGPSVGKTTRDYVHAAWDLSDSSEEDAEDSVPATADVEYEAEDDEFQVRGSKHPECAEEDEGMHGARAAAGSSPGQALSPGADRTLSQNEEEDCMLEEEDCKEKYLAAAHEPERLLDVEDSNIDNDDDDVQFMGETGPDPSKSAFQLARKRLASIRASQRSGEEEDDVELYPGVQDLIAGTLQSGRNTAHQVCDFAAELSKGSTILRHFKRLRKLPSATRTSELSERSAFWSRHTSGAGLQPGMRGGEADEPQAQADVHASAHIHHCGKGGKHRSHAHHTHHRHHHHHRHERRGRCGWRAEATAVAGRDPDSTSNASLSGGLPDSKDNEADRSPGQD